MKKIKIIIKNNLKFLIGLIIGALLSGFTVYGATIYYEGENVGYDNTSSGMVSDNVQDALDELYSLRTGTAVSSDVLTGKTFSNANGIGISGTMPNLTNSTQYQHSSSNGTKTLLADASFFTTLYNTSTSSNVGSYISFRWNGQTLANNTTVDNGYITTNTLITRPATDFGDAAAGNVLTGKTFTSTAGVKVNGSMANRGAFSKSVSSTTAQTGAAGYYSSVSCAKAANSGTFTTSTNSTAVDMGANQNYRYVNTTGVYNAGRNAATASRVKVWSGSTNGNVSVSLSGYNWVYVVTDNEATGTYQSVTLLQVGGGGKYVYTTHPGQGDFRKIITATTGGITKSDAPQWDYIYIREIWGIKNLS